MENESEVILLEVMEENVYLCASQPIPTCMLTIIRKHSLNFQSRFIKLVCLLLLLHGEPALHAQGHFRIMEYNVENCFDTVRNVAVEDGDFTPHGAQRWNSGRYWKKLGRLARVIAAAGGVTPVDLIGLVEIENDTVVRDLTDRTALACLGYDYVMTHGADVRGINVALLYQPSRFRLLQSHSLPIYNQDARKPLRDVLMVEGLLPTQDTLTVFLTHFPSRRGGVRATEANRSSVATTLREAVDSIQRSRPQAMIVVMGDFNAEVTEPCLANDLNVCDFTSSATVFDASELLETCVYSSRHSEVKGSYYYQGAWNLIDHLFVSPNIVSGGASLRADAESWQIFDAQFLLEPYEHFGTKVHRPSRTYLGPHYHGGVSDHLPIVLSMELRFED